MNLNRSGVFNVAKSKAVLVFILVLAVLALACAPEEKTPDNKTLPEKKEVVKKAKKAPKLTSSFSALAGDLIDHRDVDLNLLEALIHDEINRVKRRNKLPTLKNNKVLRNAATDQNNYQVRKGDLSHTQTTSKKQNLRDRVTYFGGGFQAMAENVMYEGFIIRTTGSKKEIIAPKYEDQAKKMVTSWMNSPSHRKNIMNPKFNLVGTAVGYNANLHAVFSTQVFGKKFN